MNRPLLSFVLILSLALNACSNDDDNFSSSEDGLNGEWVMEGRTCFCYYEEGYDYSTTLVSFDTEANTMTVLNTGEGEPFFTSGTYTYNMTGKNMLTIGDYNYLIEFKGDHKISMEYQDDPDIADDEIIYIFVRE